MSARLSTVGRQPVAFPSCRASLCVFFAKPRYRTFPYPNSHFTFKKGAPPPIRVAGRLLATTDALNLASVANRASSRPAGPPDAPGSLRAYTPGRQSDRALNVLFNSVHGTEGQKAEYVVVMDLKDDRYGSPYVVEDDALLGVVMPPPP